MAKKKVKWSDPARRSSRTTVDAGIPGAVIALLASFGLIHWTIPQTTAVMTFATGLWSLVKNIIERRYGRDFLIRKG